MHKELRRYLFIGEFDSLLLGLFSKRGEVIWVSSLEEALNQTGNFTLIMIEHNSFSTEISDELGIHYPLTPLLSVMAQSMKSRQGLSGTSPLIKYSQKKSRERKDWQGQSSVWKR